MAPLKLADGADLGVEFLRRPVAPADQLRVTDLLAAEWERSDVDWVPSLRGAYADTLTSVTSIGRCGDVDVGTATVSYAAVEPEIAVVENVTTLAEHRRRGIAAALTETVVQLAFDAGCRLCFLGNGGRVGQAAVYDRIGFARTGAIMRRAAPGFEAYERTLYASGQPVSVRAPAGATCPASRRWSRSRCPRGCWTTSAASAAPPPSRPRAACRRSRPSTTTRRAAAA